MRLVTHVMEINAVFMPANTASILQPMDQGVTSTFKSYSLNIFHKAVVAIDSDSFNRSEQSKLKTFWKGFDVLDAIKNMHDPWEEVTVPTLAGIWKKLIPAPMGDFEEFRT